MADFKIEEKNLDSILNNNSIVFHIPDFQRDYQWIAKKPKDTDDLDDETLYATTNHFDLLFQDLYLNYQHYSEDQKDYYLGSIITYKKDKKQNNVIDGQQRLTSIVIMLAAYLNILRTNDDQASIASKFSTPLGILKKPAGEFILTTSDIEGQKFLDKLYTLCDDDESAKVGVSFDENDSNLELQLTYVKAFNSALTKLNYIESEHDIDELSKFVQYLIDNIYIAFVSSESFSQAFTVFERMNDRGKPLTIPDRVKYLLMSRLTSSKKDENDTSFDMKSNKLLQQWNKVSDPLKREGISFEQFIRYHLASRYFGAGEKFPNEKLYPEVKDLLSWLKRRSHSTTIPPISKPDVFITEMETDLESYKNFWKNKNRKGEDNFYLSLKGSSFKNVRQHLPILLAARDLTGPKFALVAKTVPMLAATIYASSTAWNSIESDLINWIMQLRDKKDPSEYLDSVHEFVVDNISEVQSNILNPDFLGNNYDFRKFLLHLMDNIVGHEATGENFRFSIDRKDNIEHIIPQGKNWQESIPKLENGEVHPDWRADDVYKLVQRLGNLTLLNYYENGVADDYTPVKKMEMGVFKNSKFIISKSAQKLYLSVPSSHNNAPNKTLQKYHLSPLYIEKIGTNKHFLKNGILRREHSYLKILSEFFSIDEDRKINLEHPEIDSISKICEFCKDSKYLPDIEIAKKQ